MRSFSQISEKLGDTAIFTFGRFNPPTVGHGKLLSAARKASAGGDLKIYPSRSQDPKKNPLDPDLLKTPVPLVIIFKSKT